MSLKNATYYNVVCDYPGCTATAQDGDYSAWSDPSQAYEEANDGEWLTKYGDERRDYCTTHTIRSWDEEDEEVLKPAPDTFAWQLKDAIDLKVSQAHRKLDIAILKLDRESYYQREKERIQRMRNSFSREATA